MRVVNKLLILVSIIWTMNVAASAEFPLSPPDLSSPERTLSSFSGLAERAGNQLLTPEADEEQLVRLMDKAALSLDLSQVAKASRSRVAVESVLLLSEVLKRIPEIPADAFPDGKPERWQVPHTQLVLARDGDGRYRFDPQTIERLRKDYAAVSELPPRRGLEQDFYQQYTKTAGRLLAPEWLAWVSDLPAPFHKLYQEQALWQWLGAALLSALLVGIVSGFVRKLGMNFWLPVLLVGLLQGYVYLLDYQLNLSGGVMYGVRFAAEITTWPLLALMTYQAGTRMVKLFSYGVNQQLKYSIVRIVGTLIGVVAATLVVGYGLSRLGVPVYGIVTGLSLGGMAIALAIRPTMENLIGGVILYLDKTVQVGDFCAVGKHSGTIEVIGVRSTRIRAKDRTQIIIANGDLVKMEVVNFSRRDKYQLKFRLPLPGSLKYEELDNLLVRVRHWLEEDSRLYDEPCRAYLASLNGAVVELEIEAYVKTTDREKFLATQEAVLTSLQQLLEHQGVRLVSPYRREWVVSEPLQQGRDKPVTSPLPEAL